MGAVMSEDNSSVGTHGRVNSNEPTKIVAIKRRKMQANTAALPGSPVNKLEDNEDLSNQGSDLDEKVVS